MELKVKEFASAILALVDHETQQPIEATFANETLVSDNEAIFTVGDVNADGVLDVTGVTAGTANLTVTADASYTDKNTGNPVTVPKSAVLSVTISVPPPEAETTDLVVSLGPAVPLP